MGKTGIMGGTFDPVHLAHLCMARCALEQKKLDRVLFMPSKRPPHKEQSRVSDETLRAKLVKLAIAGEEGFVYSDFELRRRETTYTARTLTLLREQYPDEQFFFIMGGDSLEQFAGWYKPEVILQCATLLVADRNAAGRKELERQAQGLEKSFGGTVEFVEMPKMDISSSMVRRKLAAGEDVSAFLPKKVYAYICAHHCYKMAEQK